MRELDTKQREEFDATLNSGVSETSWARQAEAALDRLAAGEFDGGSARLNQSGGN